ncbi:MAG TPA: CBS domain-containing protein [Solirubrobacteraceae bacterium]|nr:CBS domain-containing protein [Solirubrobacteraceae bacterium]
MRPGVIGVSPETPLREVARTLASKHIHCVVVNDDGEVGAQRSHAMISALDLLSAAANEAFEDRTAADLAVDEPPTVSTDDHLERAVKLMADRRAEHVLVCDAEHGDPVGILSTLDVAGVMAWGEA